MLHSKFPFTSFSEWSTTARVPIQFATIGPGVYEVRACTSIWSRPNWCCSPLNRRSCSFCSWALPVSQASICAMCARNNLVRSASVGSCPPDSSATISSSSTMISTSSSLASISAAFGGPFLPGRLIAQQTTGGKGEGQKKIKHFWQTCTLRWSHFWHHMWGTKQSRAKNAGSPNKENHLLNAKQSYKVNNLELNENKVRPRPQTKKVNWTEPNLTRQPPQTTHLGNLYTQRTSPLHIHRGRHLHHLTPVK